jgi:ribonuclease P protein component
MASAPARRRSAAAKCLRRGEHAGARSSPPDWLRLRSLFAVRVSKDAAEGSLDALHEDGIPSPAGEPPGRLTRRAEYQRVSRGRRLSVAAFTLQSRRRDETEKEVVPGARVGMTVTKVVGNAVVRNRVRRRLKEALRDATPLEAEGDHDYVLMARRETLGRRFTALVEDVRTAFRAARRGEADGRGRGPAKRTTKNRDARA